MIQPQHTGGVYAGVHHVPAAATSTVASSVTGKPVYPRDQLTPLYVPPPSLELNNQPPGCATDPVGRIESISRELQRLSDQIAQTRRYIESLRPIQKADKVPPHPDRTPSFSELWSQLPNVLVLMRDDLADCERILREILD